jgi:MATE family multidrug resistance protein
MQSYFRLYRQDIFQTIRLAIPIIVAQLGVVLMGVTDTIMVGRMLGAAYLGPAGLSNSITFLIGSIGVGGLSIVSALVSRAKGEGDFKEISRLFRSGVVVGLILSSILSLINLLVIWKFEIFGQTEFITSISKPYMLILTLSNFPLMLFIAMRQLCDGLSNPKVPMKITISALLLNGIINYLLIKKVGFYGAAIGTLISRIYMFSAIIVFLKYDSFFKPYIRNLHDSISLKPRITKILKLGVPGGFQFFFEIAAFALAVIMVGWLGEAQLAAHEVAINLASVTYMMATGIAAACSIRVGAALGRNDIQGIFRAGTTAFAVVAIFMGVCCLLFLMANELLVGLYVQDNREVALIAAGLVVIAGFFQLSDGIQVVGLGALRGIADVNVPTLITLFAYWVLALPLSYVLAFHFDMNVTGVWIGLLTGLSVSAILLTTRFYSKMKRFRKG